MGVQISLQDCAFTSIDITDFYLLIKLIYLGAEGGAVAAAALAEERAAASKGGREGRKRGRRAGRRARGSGTEAVEGGESRAAASRYLLRGILWGLPWSRPRRSGTGGFGAGAWGRGTGEARRGVAAVVLLLSRSPCLSPGSVGSSRRLPASWAPIPALCGMS